MNREYLHFSYGLNLMFISVFMIVFSFASYAQDGEERDCDENLNQARRYYELGQIEKVPAVLNKCLEEGFNKTQKSEALELLVLTHQYDNKPFEAEDTYLELLKHDPEYEVNEANTPFELLRLYKTYHAPPVYSIGLIAGINSTFGQRIQSYNLGNAEDDLSEYGADGLGFQVGLTLKRYISKDFELNLNVLYNNLRFERTLNQLEFSNIVYREDQQQLLFPVSIIYDIELGKFSPYIRLGGGVSYMFTSEATIERLYGQSNIGNLPNVTGPPIDILGQRNNVNFFSTAGIGLKYKVPRGNIILDVRHNWFFLEQNRPSKRFENNILVYEYHYIDDDFKLGNVALSLGYTYSFHKIKLVKKKKKKEVTSSEE